LCPTLRAQEATCSQETVFANVTDPDGNPAPGLKATNFRASFRGRPVQILSASMNIEPRRIVLLLDASGSMLGPETGKWKAALGVAKNLVEKLPPPHSIGLLVFALKIDERVDFTQNRQAILDLLNNLQAGEKALPKGLRTTALWDAILEGLALLGSPQPGDAIYAITDGGDNASITSPGKVKRALLAARVRLFALLPPLSCLGSGRTLEEIEGPDTLEDLANTTGGALVSGCLTTLASLGGGQALEPAQLQAALDGLYRQMIKFYTLEVELPQPVDKMRDWKLEVVGLPQRSKHMSLVYPRKLVPCALGANAR
jgi:hypothetical protein